MAQPLFGNLGVNQTYRALYGVRKMALTQVRTEHEKVELVFVVSQCSTTVKRHTNHTLLIYLGRGNLHVRDRAAADADMGINNTVRTIAVFVDAFEHAVGVFLLTHGMPMQTFCMSFLHGR